MPCVIVGCGCQYCAEECGKAGVNYALDPSFIMSTGEMVINKRLDIYMVNSSEKESGKTFMKLIFFIRLCICVF